MFSCPHEYAQLKMHNIIFNMYIYINIFIFIHIHGNTWYIYIYHDNRYIVFPGCMTTMGVQSGLGDDGTSPTPLGQFFLCGFNQFFFFHFHKLPHPLSLAPPLTIFSVRPWWRPFGGAGSRKYHWKVYHADNKWMLSREIMYSVHHQPIIHPVDLL